MKRSENQMKLYIPSLSVNEGLARQAVAVFVAQLNPTIEEISDIKCAVSEAVTNCIVHGYKYSSGIIYIGVKYYSDRTVVIEIRDNGCGIENVDEAMTPLFTTDTTGERSGMGFAVMQTFMDKLVVRSKRGEGVRVQMTKKLG
ncbi:MAG: anti-sigma F factor [Clostridia bacterium]|nr:anti-sigma F factor [Clostridia bacterium]MBQ7788052.1 anti-sigma F factor [Clostridia bacterium]